MTVLRKALPAILILLMSAWPRPAYAQSGAIVNGAIGAAVVNDATDLEVSGGIGYRFNRVLGFGIEFTHVPGLDAQGPYPFGPYPFSARICCGVGEQTADGHATVFTTNVRVEVPTSMRRVLPFVVGGGGIASVTEKSSVVYYAVPLVTPSADLGASIPTPILPGPQFISTTTLAMALTLGGGASILLTDHFAIDADLRVLKLLADTGRTVGRFQAGASYRF